MVQRISPKHKTLAFGTPGIHAFFHVCEKSKDLTFLPLFHPKWQYFATGETWGVHRRSQQVEVKQYKNYSLQIVCMCMPGSVFSGKIEPFCSSRNAKKSVFLLLREKTVATGPPSNLPQCRCHSHRPQSPTSLTASLSILGLSRYA